MSVQVRSSPLVYKKAAGRITVGSFFCCRDDQGRITEIVDPSGNSLNYTYDAAGDLITFSDQVGNTWTNEYDDTHAHFLDRVVGPRGNVINEVLYDEDGRFVEVVDGLGNSVQLDFQVEDNTFVQTDRNGNETTFEFDDRGNVTRQIDALGNERLYEYNDPRHAHLETAITDGRRQHRQKRDTHTLLAQSDRIFWSVFARARSMRTFFISALLAAWNQTKRGIRDCRCLGANIQSKLMPVLKPFSI